MDQRGEFVHDAWTYYPVNSLPRQLDIVWCHFPELDKDADNPGPKPRPALVRGAGVHRKFPHRGFVSVAYGTSNIKLETRGDFDLIIQNLAERNVMGLPQATRFDLDMIVCVPWAEEWFRPRQGETSLVIGHLTPKYVDQLEVLRSRRQRDNHRPRTD